MGTLGGWPKYIVLVAWIFCSWGARSPLAFVVFCCGSFIFLPDQPGEEEGVWTGLPADRDSAFDSTSTPAPGSQGWAGPFFPLCREGPQARGPARSRGGEGRVSSRPRTSPGDVKGQAEAGLPGWKAASEVWPRSRGRRR